jgi:drug/metabolite transporter (DMT)-like permease
VTALFALASAFLAGGSDFLGGFSSRRASAVRVAASTQLVSFLVSVPIAAAVGADRVTASDVGWSIASGVVVALGLALFYGAMGRGLISLVAPIAAVAGAAVPVVYALARGERPGVAAFVGIGLALPAIAVMSFAPAHHSLDAAKAPAVIAFAIAAGVLFGAFFICLSRTSSHAGVWPASISRAASAALLVGFATFFRGGLVGRPLLRYVIPNGVLECTATVTVVLALQRGPVAIASVLASMYPVTTILLAAGILRERLTRVQLGGVALAVVAVGLVSAG